MISAFKTDDETLAIANDALYGLGARIWSRGAKPLLQVRPVDPDGASVHELRCRAYSAHAAFGRYKQYVTSRARILVTNASASSASSEDPSLPVVFGFELSARRGLTHGPDAFCRGHGLRRADHQLSNSISGSGESFCKTFIRAAVRHKQSFTTATAILPRRNELGYRGQEIIP